MNRLKANGSLGRIMLLVILATGLGLLAATTTGILGLPNPLSLIASATEPIQLFAANQMGRLDYAICEILAHIEYACTRGAV
ncbi:MAG: hypothetical protein KJ052_07700 [Candidatus Hydrogenedentes bacterium]|nr:hypothetical protein [Candidatus Hydrogenedentota bacterium]